MSPLPYPIPLLAKSSQWFDGCLQDICLQQPVRFFHDDIHSKWLHASDPSKIISLLYVFLMLSKYSSALFQKISPYHEILSTRTSNGLKCMCFSRPTSSTVSLASRSSASPTHNASGNDTSVSSAKRFAKTRTFASPDVRV